MSATRPIPHSLLLAAVALAAASPFSAHAEQSLSNLLINGGAETGDNTGWTQGGTSHPAADNGLGYFKSDNILPFQGNFDFVGGIGASGSLSQTVTFDGYSLPYEMIDSALVTFNVSFVERSYFSVPADAAAVSIQFPDGTVANSPFLTNTSFWGASSVSGHVPYGVRSATYTMLFNRNSGSDLDAFIDNNSFALTYPGSSWAGTSGFWSAPAIWRSGVPGDYAYITSKNTAGTVTFNVNSATLNFLFVDSGNGSMNFAQGIGTLTCQAEFIGNSGAGSYTQTGGTNSMQTLYLGAYQGSTGNYTITSSTLTAINIYDGFNGSGNLTINSNANVTVSQTIWVCQSATTASTCSVSNSSLATFSLYVGSLGTLTISNATVAVSNDVSAANTINFNGGSFSFKTIYLNNNPANLQWSAGTLHPLSDFALETIGTNTTLTAAKTLQVNGNLSVGDSLVTSLTLSGGNATAGNISLGASPAGRGAITLNAPSSLAATNVYVGGNASAAYGNGTLTINSGSAAFSQLTIYSTGIVNFSGGNLTLASLSTPSPSRFNWASGNLTFTTDIDVNSSFSLGNFITLANNRTLSAQALTNEGTIALSAPSALAASYLQNNASALLVGNGNVSLTSPANSTNVGNVTLSGNFSSNGNITNFGTFSLSGPQTWTNKTTFTNIGGNATFASDTGSSGTSPLNIALSSGNITFSSSQHLSSLNITAGTATLTTGALKTNALSFAGSTDNWTGQLALGANKLIVQAPGNHASVLAALQNQAHYGLTHPAAITASLPAHTALAVIDNNALATPFTLFGGLTVDKNSLLLTPELLGDANIDGTVNALDLQTVLNNFGTQTPSWTSGNFDGAPSINLTDLAYVLNNFNLTYASPSELQTANPDSPTSLPTPEPATISLFLAPFLILRRSTRPRSYKPD